MAIDTKTALKEATATIRWGSWFGDRDLELAFPSGWQVETFGPADGEAMSDSQIEAAFANPIGTRRLSELAAGKRSPCIVVDDLSRPTPTFRLLPFIFRELREAGIEASDVLILAGVANHRPMMRADFRKKIGEQALKICRVRNHFSWDNCVSIGKTSHGTPVEINAEFMASDLRILVGSILPHLATGFSGGAKLLIPGVASNATAAAWHGPNGPARALAEVSPPARTDIEEGARMVGVDCIVNVIPNSRREITGLVVGDVVQAQRRGVELGRPVFSTPTPVDFDVCVLSAYPKDNEFLQHDLAYNPWHTAPEPIVHEGGTVVVATASSEGPGFHSLEGPRMRLWPGPSLRGPVAPRTLAFLAPGINRNDLMGIEDARVHVFGTWQQTLKLLSRLYGGHARVAVFPCAAMQLAEAVCRS